MRKMICEEILYCISLEVGVNNEIVYGLFRMDLGWCCGVGALAILTLGRSRARLLGGSSARQAGQQAKLLSYLWVSQKLLT
ncbi:hypothetical protein C0Z18_27540 [Trinickia dabaoshanensis]|uniref:Uncharacterized protein n=1 Tax=Trinickia dabaoshanensis TaxID=564714 RepID=A0A2N7VE28_9BURK|nr:hypothetical protein C0Z18_27540 [Trinickia dabaoshanensis]